MKKFKIVIAVLLSSLLLLLSVGCGGKLETPVGFYLDENDTLVWSDVKDARSYNVEVTKLGDTGNEWVDTYSVHRSNYSLASLEKGEYFIRIQAIGGRKNALQSAWSEPQPYQKEESYGILYRLIDGGDAYEAYRIGGIAENGEVKIGPIFGSVFAGKDMRRPVTSIADRALRGGREITSVYVDDSVRTIGSEAFANCVKLTKVRLPETGIESLGSSAFHNCSSLTTIENLEKAKITTIGMLTFGYCAALPSVNLPESITMIDESAFYRCAAMKEFKLPPEVRVIGPSAFSSMDALTKVEFNSKLTQIGAAAFSSDTALTTVEFAPLEGSLTIGGNAFAACGLTSVTVPDGTTRLDAGAFMNCTALEEVDIPDSVTYIGTQCFDGCKFMTTQNDPKGLCYADRWLVGITEEMKPTLTALSTGDFKEGTYGISVAAFNSCPELLNVDSIPEGCIYINDYAFSNCPLLTKFIAAADSVQYLGNFALASCPTLSNVRFGDGLKEIGQYAFYGCTLLNNNTNTPEYLVPESVTHIGTDAFLDTALSLTSEDGIIYANNWVVGHAERIPQTITLREDTRGIADYVFYPRSSGEDGAEDPCEKITSVSNLSRVSYLGVGSFMGCSALVSITLNRDIRTIPVYAFAFCKALETFNDLPLRLEEVGMGAFMSCSNIAEIDLSGAPNLKYIDAYAFYNCEAATRIELGTTVQTIGDRAFFNIGHTTELTIPASVTSIGNYAFAYGDLVGDSAWMLETQYQSRLQSVSLGENVTTLGVGVFRNNVNLRSVTIPEGVTSIGDQAFYNCNRLSEVKIASTVTSIGNFAFSHTGLTSLSLPASVKSIGNFAFSSSRLESVYIPETVERLGSHVFYNTAPQGIFLAVSEIPAEWDLLWNSSFTPVFLQSEYSAEGYVTSVLSGGTENFFKVDETTGPSRTGYEFLGWATSPNATAPAFTTEELFSLPAGTRYYAVWAVGEATPPEDPEEEPGTGNAGGNTGSGDYAGRLEDFLGSLSNADVLAPELVITTLPALPMGPVLF